jgi:hypothetical protein
LGRASLSADVARRLDRGFPLQMLVVRIASARLAA